MGGTVANSKLQHSVERSSPRTRALLALIAPLPALVVGAFILDRSGVSSGLWVQNLAVGATLIAVCAAAGLAPRFGGRSGASMWTMAASVVLLLLAATLAQPGADGVRRWLLVGPVQLHVASVALPILIIAIGRIADAGSTRGALWLLRIGVIAAAAILVMQPDAAQASAFCVATAILLLWLRDASIADWFAAAIVMVCAGVAWLRFDPLAPVPHVEGVIGLAASTGTLWLLASLLALALVPLPFLALAVRGGERSREDLALAAYFVIVCAVPFVGAYPVPLLGYGLSPILGYFIALGWVIRNAAASPSRSSIAPNPAVAA